MSRGLAQTTGTDVRWWPAADRIVAVLVLATAVLLGGCAGALPQVERRPSTALVGGDDSPLVRVSRGATVPAGKSGVWPLLQASYALDARLSMIENARSSLDLQYYLIADDSIGRLVLRALRDAAGRGVRVRLLVDDLDTASTDKMLNWLAAMPNVEVRLFNPFITRRDSWFQRLVALGFDFKHLNHRMHNKLFIADGTLAIVGGRNLADEYFWRGTSGNFIDFDALVTGAVVGELRDWFDLYWNATQVYSVHDVTRAVGDTPPTAAEANRAFDDATRDVRPPAAPIAPDYFGAPAFSNGLSHGGVQFIVANCRSYADSPNKIDPDNFSVPVDDTLSHRFLIELSRTHDRALLISPYFVPGRAAIEELAKLRRRDVKVQVLTNSLAVSDEPLVNVRLARRQTQLLAMGVEIYQLSSNRLKLDRTLKGLIGTSIGRLHAKLAFLDRERSYVGSMNLDPRSARINTEIGVRIDSAKFAEMVITAFKIDSLTGVYQVKLGPNGHGLHWVATDGENTDDREVEPDTSLLQRTRLLLLSWFVPESQL